MNAKSGQSRLTNIVKNPTIICLKYLLKLYLKFYNNE